MADILLRASYGANADLANAGKVNGTMYVTTDKHTLSFYLNNNLFEITPSQAVYATSAGSVTNSLSISDDDAGISSGSTYNGSGTLKLTTFKPATSTAAGLLGFVPAPAAGDQAKYLRADGNWAIPTNTTYTFAGGTNGFTVTPNGGTSQLVNITIDTGLSVATQSADGLLSAADKTKLDGITVGAEPNVITGVGLGGASNTAAVSNKIAVIPYANGSTQGLVYSSSTVTATTIANDSTYIAAPIVDGIVYYKNTNTTYNLATDTDAGLMSAAHYLKLQNLKIGDINVPSSGVITADELRAGLGLSSALRFIGFATVAMSETSETQIDPVISGYDFSKAAIGDVVIDKDSAYEYVWTGSKWERLGPDGSYKPLQSAISSPSASGNAIAFIDTITQNINGEITATKKTVYTATASQLGLVKLGSSTTQSVAANSVTTTASRTYAIQANGDGQLVVNVPWENDNTTYNVATTSANGLMSSTDKSKLNGIATGAQVNVIESVQVNGSALAITDKAVNIPLANGTGTAGVIKTTSTVTSNSGYTAAPVISGVVYYKDTNTTYTAGDNLTLSGTQFNLAVDQTLTSGTKIATIGTTDIYSGVIWGTF